MQLRNARRRSDTIGLTNILIITTRSRLGHQVSRCCGISVMDCISMYSSIVQRFAVLPVYRVCIMQRIIDCAAYHATAQCPSVRLSQANVLSKQLNRSS